MTPVETSRKKRPSHESKRLAVGSPSALQPPPVERTPPSVAIATPSSSPARSIGLVEVAFGIVLLVLGTFILIAVSNPLEIAVYAGGPIMAVAGLAVAITALVRRSGIPPVVFGAVAFLLGSGLAIHDLLFPPGIAIFIHLGIALATLLLGILQLAAKKRYYARWFRHGQPNSS